MGVLKLLFQRDSCSSGQSFYVCSSSGFTGCCSVDACQSSDGCPDSSSSSDSSAPVSSSNPTSLASSAILSVSSLPSTPTNSHSIQSSSTGKPSTNNAQNTQTASPTDVHGSVTQSGPTTSSTARASPLTQTENNSTAQSSPNSSSSKNTGAIVGGVVGGLLILGIVVACLFFLRRRRKAAAAGAPEPVGVSESSPSASPSTHHGFFGGLLKRSSMGKVSSVDAKEDGDNDPSLPPGHVELRGSMPTDAELPAEIHAELPAEERSPPPKYGFIDNNDDGKEGERKPEEQNPGVPWDNMDNGILRGNLNLSQRRSDTSTEERRRHVLSFMEYKQEGS